MVAIVVALFGLQFYQYQSATLPELTPAELAHYNTILYPQPRALVVLPLLDQNGMAFDVTAFQGHWSLVNFGYLNCTDVCPVNLVLINQAVQQLVALNITPPHTYLATVDPERDTPERLKSYLKNFGDDWQAIWAENAVMTVFAKQLNAVYMIDDSNSHADMDRGTDGQMPIYDVNHSDNIVLLNSDGKLAAIFRPPHTAEAMVAVVSRLIQTRPTPAALSSEQVY